MYVVVEGVIFSGIKAGQSFLLVCYVLTIFCYALCVIFCDYFVVYVGIVARFSFSHDCMRLIDARDMPDILNVCYTIIPLLSHEL